MDSRFRLVFLTPPGKLQQHNPDVCTALKRIFTLNEEEGQALLAQLSHTLPPSIQDEIDALNYLRQLQGLGLDVILEDLRKPAESAPEPGWLGTSGFASGCVRTDLDMTRAAALMQHYPNDADPRPGD